MATLLLNRGAAADFTARVRGLAPLGPSAAGHREAAPPPFLTWPYAQVLGVPSFLQVAGRRHTQHVRNKAVGLTHSRSLVAVRGISSDFSASS